MGPKPRKGCPDPKPDPQIFGQTAFKYPAYPLQDKMEGPMTEPPEGQSELPGPSDARGAPTDPR